MICILANTENEVSGGAKDSVVLVYKENGDTIASSYFRGISLLIVYPARCVVKA